MNKRSIKFTSLLVAITATLSILFIIASLLVDLFASNGILSDVFYYVRVAFDLIAEFSCYAIILYAYCRYPFKKAWPALLVAIGSCLLTHIFLVVAECITEYISPTENVEFGTAVLSIITAALSGIFIERIIPFMAIVLISYLCTRNGTEKISKLVSFKNPIQRAMLISSILVFSINAFPALFVVIRDLTKLNELAGYVNETEGWQTFWRILGFGALEQFAIVLYNFVLLYAVYMLVYYLCEKYSLSAPTKKTTKNETEPVAEAVSSEEK